MTYEAAVEYYLVEQVEKHGGMCLKLVDQGRRGFPDRTVIWAYPFRECRIHFVEVKTVGGRLSYLQKRYHEDLRAIGCDVLVLWTTEQVDDYVRTHGPP